MYCANNFAIKITYRYFIELFCKLFFTKCTLNFEQTDKGFDIQYNELTK